MADLPQPVTPRKIVRNIAWLVAWDEAAQRHVYRRDVDLTIEGNIIASIGPAGHHEQGEAVEIDGRGFAIFPGFVDIHSSDRSTELVPIAIVP